MLSEQQSGEAGFTLIELLVAMAASSVIMIALVFLMISVLGETQTTYARVDATQNTRNAMATLENDLHSACVGSGSNSNLAPIQPGSDANTLIFLSNTGDGVLSNTDTTDAEPSPTWNVVRYSGSQLTDTTYQTSGTSASSWAPIISTASTQVLLSNVSQSGTTPVFQYFAYQGYPGAPGGDDYWVVPDGINTLPDGAKVAADPLNSPGSLSTTQAADTVDVLITLSGGPEHTTGLSGTDPQSYSDPESDLISLRLSEPPDQAPATSGGNYGPCQ